MKLDYFIVLLYVSYCIETFYLPYNKVTIFSLEKVKREEKFISLTKTFLIIVLITFCSIKNSKDSNKGGMEKIFSILKIKKAFQNSQKLCVKKVRISSIFQ